MTARQATYGLMQQLGARGISLTFDEANTLRRAEKVLQRWAELECGDGNDYASWSIERDEQSGLPYRCTYYNEPRHFIVECLDDAGKMVRATRGRFIRKHEADAYAQTIANARTPHVKAVSERRERIADREAGALRRVKAICEAHGAALLPPDRSARLRSVREQRAAAGPQLHARRCVLRLTTRSTDRRE